MMTIFQKKKRTQPNVVLQQERVTDGVSPDDSNLMVIAAMHHRLICAAIHNRIQMKKSRLSRLRRRVRKTVNAVIEEIGDKNFRRAYRMTTVQFYALFALLKPFLPKARRRRTYVSQRAPNGVIDDEVRLACALRYFAGASVYDLCTTYGVGLSTIYQQCIWPVLAAIHKCKELDIAYPSSHDEQKRIAKRFREKSDVGFEICCGALDGLLVWGQQPRKKDCDKAKCGVRRFFCGRKGKFGLNMQAISDADAKFLEVSIKNPASSSDFLAFTRSDLFLKISKTPNFLHPDLALFGDNAYVLTNYMIVPYKSAREGPKDDFNFFHSQLRINVERAFGMLIHRWAILQRPLSKTMGIKKQVSLVVALCKLHNFCLDGTPI